MVYLDTVSNGWCHMIADSRDELMTMARRIGLRPEWLQKPGHRHEHFDIKSETKRNLAIRFGAVQVSKRELAAILARKKEPQP